MAAWSPPPASKPAVYNPYEDKLQQLHCFRPGTAFERRYAPRQAVVTAVLSADATLLCTASTDKTARVHEVDSATEIMKLKHPDMVRAARFSPLGTCMATACDDSVARIFAVSCEESAKAGPPTLCLEHRGQVTELNFSGDGKLLCTASKDRLARVFALASPQDPEVVAAIAAAAAKAAEEAQDEEPPPPPAKGAPPPPQPMPLHREDAPVQLKHSDPVHSAAFCPEGRRLCTGSGAARFFGAAMVFEIETQHEILSFQGHADSVTHARFGSQGKLLVTASRDKTARIFNLEDRREAASFVHENWVSTAELSTDGRWLCTACDDGYARVFDLRTRQELAKFSHECPVLCVAFGPWLGTSNQSLPPPLNLVTGAADGAARILGVQ